jgi:hypothetical protein
MICPHCGRCSCCGHPAQERWWWYGEPCGREVLPPRPRPLIPSPSMYGNVNDALRVARAAIHA